MEELQKIEHLIQKGNLQTAIDRLNQVDLKPSLKKEALLISARYRRLKRARILKVLSIRDDNITENQITQSLLELIQHPEEEPFNEKSSISQRSPLKVRLWKAVAAFALLVGMVSGLLSIGTVLFPGPAPSTTNTVSVRVHGSKGVDQKVLPGRGLVTLMYGQEVYPKQINNDGVAVFTELPDKFFGIKDSVRILFEDPLDEPWGVVRDSFFHLDREHMVQLEVKRFQLDTIQGFVSDFETGKGIEDVEILILGKTAFSGRWGYFKLGIPTKDQAPFVTIRAFKEEYKNLKLNHVAVDSRLSLEFNMKPEG